MEQREERNGNRTSKPNNQKNVEVYGGNFGRAAFGDQNLTKHADQDYIKGATVTKFDVRHGVFTGARFGDKTVHNTYYLNCEGMSSNPNDTFLLKPRICVYEENPINPESRILRGKLLSSLVKDHDIALKILPDNKYAEREASMHFSIPPHPNIVHPIFADKFKYRGQSSIYIALELCDSLNLYSYIKLLNEKRDPFAANLICSYVRQITDAVAFLHRHQIINRDLKPHNILLNADKTVAKLCDFGMCKPMNTDTTQMSRLQSGTLGWMSPEVLRRKEQISLSADIFSLGLIHYFLLSYGDHPFGNPVSRDHNIISNKDPCLNNIKVLNTESVILLIASMLDPEPTSRPKAEEVKANLEQILTSSVLPIRQISSTFSAAEGTTRRRSQIESNYNNQQRKRQRPHSIAGPIAIAENFQAKKQFNIKKKNTDELIKQPGAVLQQSQENTKVLQQNHDNTKAGSFVPVKKHLNHQEKDADELIKPSRKLLLQCQYTTKVDFYVSGKKHNKKEEVADERKNPSTKILQQRQDNTKVEIHVPGSATPRVSTRSTGIDFSNLKTSDIKSSIMAIPRFCFDKVSNTIAKFSHGKERSDMEKEREQKPDGKIKTLIKILNLRQEVKKIGSNKQERSHKIKTSADKMIELPRKTAQHSQKANQDLSTQPVSTASLKNASEAENAYARSIKSNNEKRSPEICKIAVPRSSAKNFQDKEHPDKRKRNKEEETMRKIEEVADKKSESSVKVIHVSQEDEKIDFDKKGFATQKYSTLISETSATNTQSMLRRWKVPQADSTVPVTARLNRSSSRAEEHSDKKVTDKLAEPSRKKHRNTQKGHRDLPTQQVITASLKNTSEAEIQSKKPSRLRKIAFTDNDAESDQDWLTKLLSTASPNGSSSSEDTDARLCHVKSHCSHQRSKSPLSHLFAAQKHADKETSEDKRTETSRKKFQQRQKGQRDLATQQVSTASSKYTSEAENSYARNSSMEPKDRGQRKNSLRITFPDTNAKCYQGQKYSDKKETSEDKQTEKFRQNMQQSQRGHEDEEYPDKRKKQKEEETMKKIEKVADKKAESSVKVLHVSQEDEKIGFDKQAEGHSDKNEAGANKQIEPFRKKLPQSEESHQDFVSKLFINWSPISSSRSEATDARRSTVDACYRHKQSKSPQPHLNTARQHSDEEKKSTNELSKLSTRKTLQRNQEDNNVDCNLQAQQISTVSSKDTFKTENRYTKSSSVESFEKQQRKKHSRAHKITSQNTIAATFKDKEHRDKRKKEKRETKKKGEKVADMKTESSVKVIFASQKNENIGFGKHDFVTQQRSTLISATSDTNTKTMSRIGTVPQGDSSVQVTTRLNRSSSRAAEHFIENEAGANMQVEPSRKKFQQGEESHRDEVHYDKGRKKKEETMKKREQFDMKAELSVKLLHVSQQDEKIGFDKQAQKNSDIKETNEDKQTESSRTKFQQSLEGHSDCLTRLLSTAPPSGSSRSEETNARRFTVKSRYKHQQSKSSQAHLTEDLPSEQISIAFSKGTSGSKNIYTRSSSMQSDYQHRQDKRLRSLTIAGPHALAESFRDLPPQQVSIASSKDTLEAENRHTGSSSMESDNMHRRRKHLRPRTISGPHSIAEKFQEDYFDKKDEGTNKPMEPSQKKLQQKKDSNTEEKVPRTMIRQSKSETKSQLQDEIDMMKSLEHENVMLVYGRVFFTHSTPFRFELEYMEKGYLSDFVRNYYQLKQSQLTAMATQVTMGMAYIASEEIVHRDLQACNIYVGPQQKCKIGGFHRAKRLNGGTYVCDEEDLINNKLTDPEVFKSYKFNKKSDIWSFGMLLNEIFTRGKIPYPDMTPEQVRDNYYKGNKLPKPNVQNQVCEMMSECFNNYAEQRPKFEYLQFRLQEIFPTEGARSKIHSRRSFFENA